VSVCPSVTSQYLLFNLYYVSLCFYLRVNKDEYNIASKRLDESSWFLAQRLPSTYRTLCYKELSVSPKIRILPSGTLSQTSDLENCATASRSRCQQNSSSSLSTVEFVGDTYTAVDESWLFTTTHKSVNCNPLTPFDLLKICRATCNMVGRPCVCLCLCLSVTNRSSTKTAKRRITKQHHTIAQGV